MDRLTLIHPSHMHIVATLPSIHQQYLQAQLTPCQLEVDADQEYARVWKTCRPHDTTADILRHHEQGLWEYNPALALEPSSTSTSRELTVRCTTSTMLPHELHDLWPRIFSHLTEKTAVLSRKLHDARMASRRRTRVHCVIDHVLNSSSYDLMDHQDAIARALEGWQDLHMFMSKWVLEWCDNNIPPAHTCFLEIARKMGLQGCLPPLINPGWFKPDFSVSTAGYMVCDC